MKEINYRFMEKRDAYRAYRIMRSAFSSPWGIKEFEDGLKLSYNICMVAEDGDLVIGFCIFRVLFDTADLDMIVVSKDYRNQSIGSHMIDLGIKEIKKTEAQRIMLEVRDSNTEARRLYERMGFKQISTRKEYYANPSEDAIIMEMNLYA